MQWQDISLITVLKPIHRTHYIAEFHPGRTPDSNRPLFYSKRDNLPHKLTTDASRIILSKYVDMARKLCPEFPEKVGCHTFRHSKSVHLLQSGVNLIYIRDFLGLPGIPGKPKY
jgi:site-specific recombinase XerD